MKIDVLLLNFTKKNSAKFKEYLSKDLYIVKTLEYHDKISLIEHKANIIIIDNTNDENLINLKTLFKFKNDLYLRNTAILLYGEIEEIEKKYLSYFDDIIEISNDANLIKAKIFSAIKYYLRLKDSRIKNNFENIDFKEIENTENCRVLIISDNTKIPHEISNIVMDKVMSLEYALFENYYESFLKGYSFNFDLIFINGADTIHHLVFLYSQIKSHNNLKDAHIIFIKKSVDSIFLSDILNLGINNYINYPIDKKEFNFQFRVQLRNKKYLDALKNNIIEHADSSWIDQLTGLYNKKYLSHYFSHLTSLTTKQHFALIMIDLDNFKTINDTKGHIVGDEVLKEIAAVLTQEAKNNIVVRFGGDEFLIIIINQKDKSVESHKIEKNANKLIKSIQNKTKNQLFSSANLRLSLSIGLATDEDGDSILEIVNQADKSMYKAKFLNKH